MGQPEQPPSQERKNRARELGGTILFLAVETGAALMAEALGWLVVAVIALVGFGVLAWGWWPEIATFTKRHSLLDQIVGLIGYMLSEYVFFLGASLLFVA